MNAPLRTWLFPAIAVLLLPAAFGSVVSAKDADVHRAVDRGLQWLAARQNSRQGYWSGNNGRYPTAMTALAGTALLCEGSISGW